MRVLISTTGTGIGGRERLKSMVDGFIEKVVNVLRPDKIVLFYTEESREMVNLIKSRVDVEVEEIKLIDADDFNSCFNIMFETLKKYAGAEVLVNYTYGTKTISSAIASSAVFANAKLVYISGERKNGVVKSGLEKVLISDAYRLRDAMALERVAKFFNAHNFDAAIAEAQNLKAFEAKDELIKFLSAYRCWNLFNHSDAFELLKTSWKELTKLVDVNRVKSNIEFLGRLLNSRSDVERLKRLLLDLVENARRKIESGSYDDAVARLYRATELISQILLKEEGYSDPIVIDENNMSEKDRIIIRACGEFAEKKNGRIEFKVGLMKKIEILSEFELQIAIEMRNDKKLNDLLKRRNESILAHGFRVMKKEDAEKLYDHLLPYVRRIYGKYYDVDSERCKFPKMVVV
jgi:CRISPR-associated protein (TIGR02710 family)